MSSSVGDLLDIETLAERIKVDQWSCTSVNVSQLRYMWTIKKFSFCIDQLRSPTFVGQDGNEWQLSISWGKPNELSLYAHLVSITKDKVRFKFKGFIVNDKGQSAHSRRGDTLYTLAPAGFPCFIDRRTLEDTTNCMLPNDTLTIFCIISIVLNIADSGCMLPNPARIAAKEPFQDLRERFEKLTFTDLTVVVESKEFPAHKMVLANQSDVFAAMFYHNMEENKTNRVVISDIKESVVQEMLHFMYTGKAPNLKKMAEELLAAADKYALETLKNMCESVLAAELTTGIAVQTFLLADRYNAKLLKEKTIDFIEKNLSAVIKAEGWTNMMTKYSHVLSEVFKTPQ